MPFVFSEVATKALDADDRLIDDRRNNPVRGRSTKFRLAQQNMISYTYEAFVPGFGPPAINSLPFKDLVERPTVNARAEGHLLYGTDFSLTTGQVGKVEGDVFELLVAGVFWNAAARWNQLMMGGAWPSTPRYSKPTATPDSQRRVAALSLPREYDWVKLLTPDAAAAVADVRAKLAVTGTNLPTSTPDLVIVRLGGMAEVLGPADLAELSNLDALSQRQLYSVHARFEGQVEPSDLLAAIAIKKSLRSDRLYQPLYEANVMHLLLNGYLDVAHHLRFEVHTLDSEGTRAIDTYRAAAFADVASDPTTAKRAVDELYSPDDAGALTRHAFALVETLS